MTPVQALAQAASLAYDGGTDANGEPLKIGLRREEGDFIKDSRHMDGFTARFAGDILTITYQTDIKLKEVYGGGFEEEVERVMADIAKYLSTRATQILGKRVTIGAVDEVDILVQSTSNVRVFATAIKKYKIRGMKGVDENPPIPAQDKLMETYRRFVRDARGL
tara:strand:- start:474 stop:965 length:492 start_codon:yes stop_codon:yes gene_type:complete